MLTGQKLYMLRHKRKSFSLSAACSRLPVSGSCWFPVCWLFSAGQKSVLITEGLSVPASADWHGSSSIKRRLITATWFRFT
jgi:hypothetical protein